MESDRILQDAVDQMREVRKSKGWPVVFLARLQIPKLRRYVVGRFLGGCYISTLLVLAFGALEWVIITQSLDIQLPEEARFCQFSRG